MKKEKLNRQQELEKEILELRSRQQDQERRYVIMEEAFSSNPDSITVADVRHGKILMVNQATEDLLGYTEWQNSHPDEFDIWVDKRERDSFFHWLRNQKEDDFYEATLRRQDGSIFLAQITGRLINYEGELLSVTNIRDITEQRAREKEQEDLREQMLQTQKLESLGVLASGVAHDFNNFLAVILGNADLARKFSGDSPKANVFIDRIKTAGDRATDLTRQLLAYSGKGELIVEQFNLSTLVEQIGDLLKVSVDKNCQMDYQLMADLPLLKGDKTQIQQVVMNILINASDSLEGRAGTVKVTTGVEQGAVYIAADFVGKCPEEGPHVFLEVRDTGIGMDEETLKHIFEPFFTTKLTGRGLGMAAVLGIINSHRGAIQISTSQGEGTTFRVLFPVVESIEPNQ